MDDYNYAPYDAGYSYAPTFTVVDHYAESYNYATVDPIAITIRHQREDEERRLYEDESVQEWAWSAPSVSSYSPEPLISDSHSDDPSFREVATEYTAIREYVPDASYKALANAVARDNSPSLPGEPTGWDRLLSPQSDLSALRKRRPCTVLSYRS